MTPQNEKRPGLAGRGGAEDQHHDTRPLLLSEPEAARRLGISPRALWQLARDGAVPVERIKGCKRYSTEALTIWIRLGCPCAPGSADRVREILRGGAA